MKAASLREQTVEELNQLLLDTQKELFELKAKRGVGDKSGQPVRMRWLRRDIARIKTVLRQRVSATPAAAKA
jgi:large subunit ribosomal protein L29